MLLAFAAPQTSLIDRAAEMADLFWTQFTAVQCTERVTQNRLDAKGKLISTQTSEFDYVAFLKEERLALSVQESRVALSPAPRNAKGGQLLLTSGFPTLLLMFHPDFRDRFIFEEGPVDDKSGAVRVAFESKPGVRSMSGLKLKDRVYPILWKGTAWLDPSSGMVRRIEAALAFPMKDLGLEGLRADVEYAPVRLEGAKEPFWLPARATVSLKTEHQEWRNVHEFSHYRRFNVSTSTRQGTSK